MDVSENNEQKLQMSLSEGQRDGRKEGGREEKERHYWTGARGGGAVWLDEILLHRCWGSPLAHISCQRGPRLPGVGAALAPLSHSVSGCEHGSGVTARVDFRTWGWIEICQGFCVSSVFPTSNSATISVSCCLLSLSAPGWQEMLGGSMGRRDG